MNKKEMQELFEKYVQDIDVFNEQKEALNESMDVVNNTRGEVSDVRNGIIKIQEEIEARAGNVVNKIDALENKFFPEQEESYEERCDNLLNKMNETSDFIKSTNEELQQQKKEIVTVLEEVQSLLPKGSASGLAGIYQNKIKEMQKPKNRWLYFVILCSLALSALGFWFVMDLIAGKLLFLELIFAKIFVAIPLIWLLIFSASRYIDLIKLERAYAHKEEVARVYIGFKNYLENRATEDSTDEQIVTSINELTEGLIKAFLEKIETYKPKKTPKLLSAIFDLKKLILRQGQTEVEVETNNENP